MKRTPSWLWLFTVAAAAALGLAAHAPNVLAQSTPGVEQPSLVAPGLDWTGGYTLILTDATTLDQAYEVVDHIEDSGGNVAIVVSPRMLLGWTTARTEKAGHLRATYSRPYRGSLRGMTLDETEAIAFFNKVASGEWRVEKESITNAPTGFTFPDAFDGPPSPSGGPGQSVSASPGNSDIMAGRVSYNVFYVESNGIVDANVYSWTCADLSTIVAEVSASLSFWSSRAANFGTPLTFVTTHNRPSIVGALPCSGTANVKQPYEPILHPGPGGDSLWISAIMCNYGQCVGDKFARTNAYNTAQRVTKNTNWSTMQFVGYNPAPAPTTFTDGYFAYAYRSGHYTQLLFRNNGWLLSQYDLVSSHETGHLFGAFDEYTSSGCSNCTVGDVASKQVVNGNCANCSVEVACIMKNNELALCPYTPGQIGWGLDINYVQTVQAVLNTVKTNWVPGQTVRYQASVDLPGQGEVVGVRSRWYREFPNPAGAGGTLVESEYFDQPGITTAGGNRIVTLTRTIPAGAGIGEAALQVFFEFYYDNGSRYGNGMRSSARGKFYILNGSANAASLAPVRDDPPMVEIKR